MNGNGLSSGLVDIVTRHFNNYSCTNTPHDTPPNATTRDCHHIIALERMPCNASLATWPCAAVLGLGTWDRMSELFSAQITASQAENSRLALDSKRPLFQKTKMLKVNVRVYGPPSNLTQPLLVLGRGRSSE